MIGMTKLKNKLLKFVLVIGMILLFPFMVLSSEFESVYNFIERKQEGQNDE